MTYHDFGPPPADQVRTLVRGELTSTRRWQYRFILLAASLVVAIVLSLWGTEPRPLPTRLHVAFAALTAIGGGWIGVLMWILARRNCPSVQDRVATGWMATIACTVFLAVSVPIALTRGDTGAAIGLAATGLVSLGVAGRMLQAAYSLRASLHRQLAQLSATSHAVHK